MMVFTDEAAKWPLRSKRVVEVGMYMALYHYARLLLPPRLRRSPEQLTEIVAKPIFGNAGDWEASLRACCKDVQIPFFPNSMWAAKLDRQTKRFMPLPDECKA